MGNGGLYYKPYTYYYVTDAEDNIIIDNRNAVPKECYSPETAYIMNRLLHYNMTYCANTNAHYGRIDGWDIIGKTGTTDRDKDSWFVGTSPYATLAVWTGFDQPRTISAYGQRNATTLFQKVMSHYLEGKEKKEYVKPSTIVQANYDPSTGLTYNVGDPHDGMYIGYYKEGNMPEYSNLYVNYGDGAYSDDEKSTDSTDDTGATETGSTEPVGATEEETKQPQTATEVTETATTKTEETEAQNNEPETAAE